VLSQSVKYGMARTSPFPIGFQIILNSEEGFSFQWDSSKSLSLSDDIDNRLISVCLEVPYFEVTDFGFSKSGGKESKENCLITFALETSTIGNSENGFGLFFGKEFCLFLFHCSTSIQS
jgi:hypothetical protein